MEVQTAMAQAKKAEQAAITAEKNGGAEAAKAKWAHEVIKAKEVTAAQLGWRSRGSTRKLPSRRRGSRSGLGEGEAERRKLVMSADGALEIKVEAYLEAQKIWADALAGFKGKLVPDVVMGQSAPNGTTTVQTMMDLIATKAQRISRSR